MAGTDGLRFEQRSAAAMQAVRGPGSEDWEESFHEEGTANGKPLGLWAACLGLGSISDKIAQSLF